MAFAPEQVQATLACLESSHILFTLRSSRSRPILKFTMVAARRQVKVVKSEGTFLKFKTSEALTRHMCSTCGCHMFGQLGGDSPNVVSTQNGHNRLL